MEIHSNSIIFYPNPLKITFFMENLVTSTQAPSRFEYKGYLSGLLLFRKTKLFYKYLVVNNITLR